MSKEVKIGILALVTIVVFIWGYQFLKGKNLFSDVNEYHIVFNNVEQLEVASPVLVNGYKVGSVTKIRISPKHFSDVLVDINVNGDVKVPKGTRAVIINLGLVGGKAIQLEIDRDCNGDACAQSGSYLKGESRSMLSSMVPKSELDVYLNKIKTVFIGDSIEGKTKTGDFVTEIAEIVKNLSSATAKLNSILAKTDKNIERSVANVQYLSTNLKNKSGKINEIIDNLSEISKELKSVDINSISRKTDKSIDGLSKSIESLNKVLKKTDGSIEDINKIVKNVENGNGSLGKLIKDEELYDKLDLTVKHTNLLLQDLRLHPERYFNISLFKGKSQEYKTEKNDPGLED